MNKIYNSLRGLIVLAVLLLAAAVSVSIIFADEVSVEYQSHDTHVHVEFLHHK